MQNFAEELSYWYLRLNGFFPISNFVLHKSENIAQTADEDIIAIRPPFVYEKICEKEMEYDDKLFEKLKLDTDSIAAMICQVKGGKKNGNSDNNLFQKKRLDVCVKRIGLFKTSETKQIVEELTSKPFVSRQSEQGQKYQIIKLLISRSKPQKLENRPYLWCSINDIYDFTKERINKYFDRKYPDRYFFNSPVLQTIIESCQFEQSNNEYRK